MQPTPPQSEDYVVDWCYIAEKFKEMQLEIEFDKSEFVFTGNRFSGFNIQKVRYDFFPKLIDGGLSVTLQFTVVLDFLEVSDQARYCHNAIFNIPKDIMENVGTISMLKDSFRKIGDELINRFTNNSLFKFLELDATLIDKMPENELGERLGRIIADYDNGVF